MYFQRFGNRHDLTKTRVLLSKFYSVQSAELHIRKKGEFLLS